MKAGETALIPVSIDIDASLVDTIVFTLKSTTGKVQKTYPTEVTLVDGKFKIPLTQEDTTTIQGHYSMEAQINYGNLSVVKTGVVKGYCASTLATTIITGNTPDGEEEEVTLTVSAPIVELQGEDGKSAYQSYLDTTTDNPPLSEAEWSANRAEYTLPTAGPDTKGGVQPVAKTPAMTQPVGVNDKGELYTAPSGGGTNIGQVSFSGSKSNSFPVITFTDDDGKEGTYTLWKSICEGYGIGVDVGIIPYMIDHDAMTNAQLLELYNVGCNIVSHGYYHTNMSLVDKNYRRFKARVDAKLSYEWLYEHGYWHNDGGNLIVYPNNVINADAEIGYRAYFDMGVGTNSQVGHNYTPINPFSLSRAFINASTTLDEMKSKVDECVANNSWLIIGMHGWENASTARIEVIDALVQYIISLNVPILTSYEAWKVKGNIIESGIYDDDGRFQKRLRVSYDGNMLNDVYHDDSAIVPCTSVSIQSVYNLSNRTPITITPVIAPLNTTNNNIWAISDTGVATITQDGVLTAVADGTATLFLSCGIKQCSARVVVSLDISCTNITTNVDSLEFSDNNPQTITTTILPADCTDTVLFASSNTDVAVVSSAGVVTPISDGTCNITITCGGITKVISVITQGVTQVDYVLPDWDETTYPYYTLIKDENSTRSDGCKYKLIFSNKDLNKKWKATISSINAIRYTNETQVFTAGQFNSVDGINWVGSGTANATNKSIGIFDRYFTDTQYTLDTNCSYTETIL